MEMMTNREPNSTASLLATVFPQAHPVRASIRQQPEKTKLQPVETEFSARLSAALDESSRRVELAGKTSEKRATSKNGEKDSEQAQATGLVSLLTAASESSNDQAGTTGTEGLVDLKNAALQGLAAVAASVMTPGLPFIAQAIVPAVANAPVLTALANGVATAVTQLFNPETEKSQSKPKAVETPLVQGSVNDGKIMDTATHARTPVVMPEPLTKSSMNPVPIPQTVQATETPVVLVPTATVMIDERTAPGLSATVVSQANQELVNPPRQVAQGNHVVFQQEIQPVLNANQQDTMLQRQIQQDLIKAEVSTVFNTPVVAAVVAKPVTEPIVATKPASVDANNPAPLLGTVELTTEPVVKSSSSEELTKRFMSHSDTDAKTGLSEKNDASLSVPIGFDRVMTAVTQPVAVAPPVTQPQPDLHEVVKQVLDGMSSPTQQLKSSQVIITLKPEHLGEVTVKINVDGDKVTAAFHAASSEVRGVLESSMAQLKQEMSQQGWNFDSDGVFAGMQEFLGQQEQRQTHQQQMPGMTNHARRGDYDDAFAFSSNGKVQLMSATAVDYRI